MERRGRGKGASLAAYGGTLWGRLRKALNHKRGPNPICTVRGCCFGSNEPFGGRG